MNKKSHQENRTRPQREDLKLSEGI